MVNLTNKPADLCWRLNAVIIGPTAIDFDVLRPIGDPTPTAADLAARAARSRAAIAEKRARWRQWANDVNRTTTGPQMRRVNEMVTRRP